MSSVIAFIPIRSGSKSIVDKNVGSFCGKPLIYWNLRALERSGEVDHIVVATDSEEYKSIINNMGFLKVHLYDRKAENAVDTASTESVMLEFIQSNFMDLKSNDIFLLVQATNPFTQTQHFTEAIQKYKHSSKTSLLTCARTKRFIWSEMGEPLNYDPFYRPRRQDFKGVLVENGAFYINTIEGIKNFMNRLTDKVMIYEMPAYSMLEIDEPDDWEQAEKLMYKYCIKPVTRDVASVRLLLTDVDGVLTDSGMYYSEDGNELKKFNTRDGKGLELLREHGIKCGIITSENTKIVENRAKKLKVNYLYQGVKNKLQVVEELCKNEGLSLDEVAYIGDDLNDYEVLTHVGFPACPKDAQVSIKKIRHIFISEVNGGRGVLREIADNILERQG